MTGLVEAVSFLAVSVTAGAAGAASIDFSVATVSLAACLLSPPLLQPAMAKDTNKVPEKKNLKICLFFLEKFFF